MPAGWRHGWAPSAALPAPGRRGGAAGGSTSGRFASITGSRTWWFPVGSLLALAAQRSFGGWSDVGAILLAFIVSGLVSSVNYAVNEVLDAPFDASHPTKRERPIPSGRIRVGPLLVLTAAVALVAFGLCWWLLPGPVLHGVGALFLAGLVYNLPPIRLKDRPYLDVVTEALTNPIRLTIGWHAVAAASPPALLLVAVWTFGAFLMTGKRLAELRLLGDVAARYRPTFRAYSVPGLFVVQLAYAAAGLVALTWLAPHHAARGAARAALGGGASHLGVPDDLRAGQPADRSGAPVSPPGLPARVRRRLRRSRHARLRIGAAR